MGEGTATSGGHWSQQPAFTSTPQVFAAPPEIIAGFMADEAEEALLTYNPVSGGVMKLRGLFVKGPVESIGSVNARRRGLKERTFAFLRRTVFDRFGRR